MATQEFFLDSKTYTETPLIHEGLEQYQGQSLLIYNNSVFKEGDFESLSRPGDSLKQDDPFSTGKFGHGFNSVFNYTDAPSVLSGTSLLLLDPHHSWSKDVPGIQPGGPIYDTKECCQDPEIKNQLAAFKAFDVDRGGSFDGTVIRLPLRSSAQAQVSHIVHREAALEDILDAFGEFIRELKGGGILFLRNITSVTFRQDGRHLASMKIIGDDNSVSEM
ncbi:MAG: hypothetical protein M1833_002555 [Piccolia ochrophora]|nr:MAG: hypothetical protein M1833_002555 [Piccolia ochrophora]